MGVLFNVMFLDHLASDVEHLDRLNKLMHDGRISQSGTQDCEKMRPLATMLITPSVDLSELARQHQKDMPYLIQYFVNGLGRDAVSCADLMSYLLFTPQYTRALIDIGYGDASKRIDEIEEFIFSPTDGNDTGRSKVQRRSLADCGRAADRIPELSAPRRQPTTRRNTTPTLFVAQRLNGVEFGGQFGWKGSEEDADRAGNPDGDDRRKKRYRQIDVGEEAE